MKNFYCSLTLLLSFFFASAQLSFWEAPSNSASIVPCPYDSTLNVSTIDNWTAYQTLNDEWDGVIDSSLCLSLSIKNNTPSVDAGIYDGSRRVFLNYNLDNTAHLLNPNSIFRATLKANGNIASSDSSCIGGYCNFFRLGIEIPDSAGTGFNKRWYNSTYTNTNNYSFANCLPIEKFSHNRISDLIIGVKGSDTAYSIDVGLFEISQGFSQIPLDSTSILNTQNGNTFVLSYNSFLLLHQSADYPNSNGIYFQDLVPAVNTPTADTVILSIEMFSSLILQPFSQFRGGQVSGDTLRHHLITQVTGGNYCISAYQDIFISPGDEFYYSGGDIRFGNDQSCIMLMKDSKLTLADSATFHYGKDGIGLLALRPGANIDFKKKAHFLFDGKMMINPKGESPDSIVIQLDKGEAIEFTAKSSIKSPYGSKLVIIDKGGEILMDQLDAKSKQWIKVLETPTPKTNHIEIERNPIDNEIGLLTSLTADYTSEITLFDIGGRPVLKQSMAFDKKDNRYAIETSSLKGGIYIMKVEMGNETFTFKILKAQN